MNLLFDTNILLYIGRDKSNYSVISKINPDDKIVYVSYANIVEIQSIAFQNNWSPERLKRLEQLLDNVRIIELSDMFFKTYIDIDAYSQRKHPDFATYPHTTPRNMGKHDLWIAATASLLNLQLITTDFDFDHLGDTFLNLRQIDSTVLRRYL